MNRDYKLILFDGVCNLCNGFVQFIIKRDPRGNFRFAPLQSTSGKSYMEAFGLDDEKFDSVIYFSGNRFYEKSAAVLHILRDIRRGWQLMYLFIVLPRFFRDIMYDLVAKNRYKIFGRRDACMIPSQEIKSRFLS